MTLHSAFLWASQNVGWAIGLLVVLLVTVWKLAQWMKDVNNTMVDVRELKNGVEAIKEELAALRERLGALDARLDIFLGNGPGSVVARTVREIRRTAPEQNIAQGSSPITLTEVGEDIACRVEADVIVECYIDSVLGDTRGMDAYDVQEFCFEFGYYKMKQDLRGRHAKHYARVSCVAYETGFAIESILRKAVGIKLRDKVLQRQREVV